MRALFLVRLEVGPLARDVAVVAGVARALEASLASTARAAVGVHLLALHSFGGWQREQVFQK